ncbi:MAG TPA: hypothetical protein VFR31_13345 [Thermoanaerobaculia bacterium]|nr:hypothetical protein [Thermoanaerobaculia bacterium]
MSTNSAVCLELIPVVKMNGVLRRESVPEPPWWLHPADWEEALQAGLAMEHLPPVASLVRGSGLVPLREITDGHLEWLIAKQIESDDGQRLDESDVVALWGGYVVAVDGAPMFMPQCCSTLAAVHGWCGVLAPGDRTGFIGEGHPCLLWQIEGDSLRLEWDEELESFEPPQLPQGMTLPLQPFRQAVRRALAEVVSLSERVSRLPIAEEFADLANALIWCDENGLERVDIESLIETVRQAG